MKVEYENNQLFKTAIRAFWKVVYLTIQDVDLFFECRCLVQNNTSVADIKMYKNVYILYNDACVQK